MSIDKIHRNALPQGFKLEEYTIESVLGHGGFGITYLAKDHHLDQWVAIKEYLPNNLAVREGMCTVYAKSKDDEPAFQWGLERFINEAKTLAQFRHEGIVKVLRFIEKNCTAYMVMEYREGQSLEEKVKKNGVLDEDTLMAMIMPILDGLEKVHEIGFLHRDIKPSNIFICDDGSPLLLDFGAARQAIQTTERSLTSVVTPGYAPFEQYDTKSEQGAWTDIYSLGGVMYFSISKQQPTEVVSRLKDDDMPRATKIGAGNYSEQLLKAIDWALAVDEEARPQSVQEFRQALLINPESLESVTFNKQTIQANNTNPIRNPNNIMVTAIIVVLSLSVGVLLYNQYASKSASGSAFLMTLLTEKNIRSFIDEYIETTRQGDANALMRFYADRVDYYAWGKVSKDTIRQDKIGFFDKWIEVNYKIVNDEVFIEDGDNPKEKIVDILFDFENVRSPKHAASFKRTVGVTKHFLRIRETPLGLKIVSHKERVLQRTRLNE